MNTGRELGSKNVGRFAIDCLRIDRVVPKMGSELTSFISPWEAGLGDRVHLDKVRTGNKLIFSTKLFTPRLHPLWRSWQRLQLIVRLLSLEPNQASLFWVQFFLGKKKGRGALLGMIETWILFTVIWKVNLIVEKLPFR